MGPGFVAHADRALPQQASLTEATGPQGGQVGMNEVSGMPGLGQATRPVWEMFFHHQVREGGQEGRGHRLGGQSPPPRKAFLPPSFLPQAWNEPRHGISPRLPPFSSEDKGALPEASLSPPHTPRLNGDHHHTCQTTNQPGTPQHVKMFGTFPHHHQNFPSHVLRDLLTARLFSWHGC